LPQQVEPTGAQNSLPLHEEQISEPEQEYGPHVTPGTIVQEFAVVPQVVPTGHA